MKAPACAQSKFVGGCLKYGTNIGTTLTLARYQCWYYANNKKGTWFAPCALQYQRWYYIKGCTLTSQPIRLARTHHALPHWLRQYCNVCVAPLVPLRPTKAHHVRWRYGRGMPHACAARYTARITWPPQGSPGAQSRQRPWRGCARAQPQLACCPFAGLWPVAAAMPPT